MKKCPTSTSVEADKDGIFNAFHANSSPPPLRRRAIIKRDSTWAAADHNWSACMQTEYVCRYFVEISPRISIGK